MSSAANTGYHILFIIMNKNSYPSDTLPLHPLQVQFYLYVQCLMNTELTKTWNKYNCRLMEITKITMVGSASSTFFSLAQSSSIDGLLNENSFFG